MSSRCDNRFCICSLCKVGPGCDLGSTIVEVVQYLSQHGRAVLASEGPGLLDRTWASLLRQALRLADLVLAVPPLISISLADLRSLRIAV